MYKNLLQGEHNNSKQYGDYIENYNKIAADLKNLDAQKNEIENMQSQLKKLEGSIKGEHSTNLQLLK